MAMTQNINDLKMLIKNIFYPKKQYYLYKKLSPKFYIHYLLFHYLNWSSEEAEITQSSLDSEVRTINEAWLCILIHSFMATDMFIHLREYWAHFEAGRLFWNRAEQMHAVFS